MEAQHYVVNVTSVSLTLPEATEGNGNATYSLTPALPAGLVFNPTTRGLSGVPTREQGATTYALIAHDADADRAAGDAGSLNFAIETSVAAMGRSVRINPMGSEGSSPPFTTGETIAIVVDFTRGVDYLFQTTSLKLDIGGRERVAQEDTPCEWNSFRMQFLYTVQATDFDGDGIGIATEPFNGSISSTVGIFPNARRVDAKLNIGDHVIANDQPYTVNDRQPSFGAASVPAQHYRKNVAITALELPAATDGNRFGANRQPVATAGTLDYAVSPDLPAGLTYTPPSNGGSGGRISGTPTEAQAEKTYALAA